MTGCVLIEAYFVDSHSWLCEETKSTHGQLCAEVHIFGMVEYLANHVAQGLQYLKKTLNVHSAESQMCSKLFLRFKNGLPTSKLPFQLYIILKSTFQYRN